MKCHDIQTLLPVRRELSWTQQQELQAHLAGCSACAGAWRRTERAQRVLHTLQTPAAAPPQRIAANVSARLVGTPLRHTRRVRGMVLAGVALMGIVVLLGLLK